ncbi:hypothetical protein GCM10023185_06930 [Hymenobacter saemangeumensis]|uniref:ATP-dependent Clp protease proteolytic subunit n=1 Tax=Hymenobacter saemangeumensis TaxID=1084522 RepID=A0ABP8I2F4_9BACT
MTYGKFSLDYSREFAAPALLGQFWGIMQREFLLFQVIESHHAAQLDQFLSELEAAGARTATIRINSPGGSWNAGQLMQSRMMMSKVKLTTINEGLVGSAATLPFAAGNVRQCQPHAKFMMHQVANDLGPAVNEEALNRALAAHKSLNRSTAEMYAAVSTKSADEWVEMMRKETWLSAEEAKAIGYCTEVLPAKAGLVAPEATMAVGALHGYYMSIISQSTEMKLDEVKNALRLAGVTLPDNATEAEALAAIGKLKNQTVEAVAATLKPTPEESDELKELRKELEQLKAGQASEQTRRIEETVNSAVSAGKITAAQKDTYKALLGADFTNTAKVLSEMPGRQSVAARTGAAAANGTGETRNDWDFAKWGKEDPKGLRDMRQNEPEKYQNLVNSYIG